jgi:hypothetical protein
MDTIDKMSPAFQHAVSDMVRREVLVCLSGLVSTLASGDGEASGRSDLGELCAEAVELCYPVPDYEEAAKAEGWHVSDADPITFENTEDPDLVALADPDDNDGWRDLCEEFRIDADDYAREIFEHWAVSSWLAERLREQGEKVGTLDNFTVWCRTTTGQAISVDGVIETIYANSQRV